MQTLKKLDAQNHEVSTRAARDGAVCRRRFLLTGTMAGLSAGFLLEPGAIFADVFAGRQHRGARNFDYGRNLPNEAKLDPVYSLTRSRFTPLLGDQFIVIAEENEKVRLNLIEINDLKQPSNADLSGDEEREKELSFRLSFFGPLEPALSQQTCAFKHNTLGRFSVLVVPVGSNDNGRYYEVIFNRSHE